MARLSNEQIKDIFVSNLTRIMKDRDIDGAALARMIGKEKQSIYAWINKKAFPSTASLQSLVDALGVSTDDLLAKKETGDFVDVPVLGVIAAGTPIDMMEIDDTHPCPTIIKNSHPNSGWLKVEGDSYNEKLPNGCYALVDFDLKEPKENTPFAVCVNGYNATIKDVKKLANGFELIPRSYDPTYLPIIYDYNKEDTEEITIIGQVVYASFPFDWEF